MPQNLLDDQSTLVQVMAWGCQATSHYLSQCWPRSLLPHGITRWQWVTIRPPKVSKLQHWEWISLSHSKYLTGTLPALLPRRRLPKFREFWCQNVLPLDELGNHPPVGIVCICCEYTDVRFGFLLVLALQVIVDIQTDGGRLGCRCRDQTQNRINKSSLRQRHILVSHQCKIGPLYFQ